MDKKTAAHLIKAIDAHASKLTGWETSFIKKVRQLSVLTAKQSKALQDLYRKVESGDVWNN